MFGDQLYKQIEGVAVGSPNAFLCYHEKKSGSQIVLMNSNPLNIIAM